jgi:hypothetical protein
MPFSSLLLICISGKIDKQKAVEETKAQLRRHRAAFIREYMAEPREGPSPCAFCTNTNNTNCAHQAEDVVTEIETAESMTGWEGPAPTTRVCF